MTGSMKILVVDDAKFNRNLITVLLEKHGYHVTAVVSGERALAMCQTEAFGAILMDVNLPGMSGVEATQQIRRQPGPSQATVIVGLTAHASNKDRMDFLESGMNGCLAKPIDLQQLIDLLNRYVGHQKEHRKGGPIGHQNGGNCLPRDHNTLSSTPGTGPGTCSETDQASKPCVFDVEDALQRLGSNQTLLDGFIEIFREDVPGLMEQAAVAVTDDDAAGLEKLAHRLRGIAANLSALAMSKSAHQLEKVCQQGLSHQIARKFHRLTADVQELQLEFQRLEQSR